MEKIKKEADAYSKRTGRPAYVLKFDFGYDYVDKAYFKTYKPKSRIGKFLYFFGWDIRKIYYKSCDSQ